MLTLIILIVFGLGTAYFAAQNTGLVHLSLANYYVGGIPLYIVVIGSMLLGIFISWFISIANGISSSLRFHGKETELKKAHQTIDTLNKKNSDLLAENTHLREEKAIPAHPVERNEDVQIEIDERPTLGQRIKQSFA